MKSLKESLFDNDLTTKNITFGDLFDIDEQASKWEQYNLKKYFSIRKIKQVTKVSGSGEDEIIFKGFVKLIKDIIFDNIKEIDKIWFESKIRECIVPFYKSSFAYIPPEVFFINNGWRIFVNNENLFSNKLNTIQISIPYRLNIVFRRK